MVINHSLDAETRGQGDVVDLTRDLAVAVTASPLRNGIATVFVIGSTAAITTIEFESGAIADLGRAYDRVAPRNAEYQHHLRWGDDNGSSHVRAAMLGPSLTIPIVEGKLALGTWQQVVLVEFDTSPRQRTVIIQLLGEAALDDGTRRGPKSV